MARWSGGTVSRALLCAFFSVGGVLHFVLPVAYGRIMPPWLPAHHALVLISGACEIAGGLGVLHPATRRLAGWALIALSIAVLPANLQMVLNYQQAGAPLWQQALLLLRLPLQGLLIWWIWRATGLAAPARARAAS